MQLFWRAARAQPRARPYNVWKSILSAQEMLFGYLIAVLAQKAYFLYPLEIYSFFKKSTFLAKIAILSQKVDFLKNDQLSS